MSRKTFAPFDPALLERAGMDAFKKLETRKQRRESTKFVLSLSRVVTSVLVIALLVGIVVLIGLVSYVPAMWPAIEHLFWK